jgi:hypothetical protein
MIFFLDLFYVLNKIHDFLFILGEAAQLMIQQQRAVE